MNLSVYPGRPLVGNVKLPGDKSLSHRAALFAALAEGQSMIENFLVSGVTQAMLDCLQSLGVPWYLEGTTLTVEGRAWQRLSPPGKPLDCGNSATTLRMLAGAISTAGIPAVLDGSPGLRRRPMGRILEPLRQMGVQVKAASGDCAPLVFEGRPKGQPLRAIEYSLPVASAQVKSCLLLAGLAADGPLHLHEPGPSRDHTERMLSHMGAQIKTTRDQGGPGSTVTLLPLSVSLRPLHLQLPGDFSSAAFLIVAALITPGSQITLENVGLNPTRTGLLDVLKEMGADIRIIQVREQAGEPCGDLLVRHSRLRAGRVSGERVVRMIDEFPAFAVAACQAEGTSQVCDAAELRVKESDRIAALAQELRALEIEIQEAADGFTIRGGKGISCGSVSPHKDHRLAMALAIAGLAGRQPLQVQGAEIIAESFPEFSQVLTELGADLRVEDESHVK